MYKDRLCCILEINIMVYVNYTSTKTKWAKNMKRHFTQVDIQMTYQLMKRFNLRSC